MKFLLRLAVGLYPPAWRARYGVEFQALLDETRPGWRDIADVLNGGLQMRLRYLHPAVTVAALGIAGAILSGAIAFNTTGRFASTGTLNVRPAGSPTASNGARVEDDVMPGLARVAFSRDALMAIIQQHGLYRSVRSSPDDLVDRMRGDIRIQLVSPSVVRVSFASTEARQTQQVAGELMSRLVSANLEAGRGSTVQLIDPPAEPRASVSPRPIVMASVGGLGGGALIGMVIGLLRRRRIDSKG
jgi:uncharacterized protein involved in exopolysaccharide biosynthesis